MTEPDVTLVIMPGSPYVMKAMCALESRGITFDTVWADMMHLGTQLRSLPEPQEVPVLVWNGEIVQDSTNILSFVDKQLPAGTARLLPTAGEAGSGEVQALEEEVDERLTKFIFYFNFVDEEGFRRSFHKTMDLMLPSFVKALGLTPEVAVRASGRLEKLQAQVEDLLKPSLADGEIVDGAVVMERGIKPLLRKYEGCLARNSGQKFLCGGDLPSGADCALYAALERAAGSAGDSGLSPALPGLVTGYPLLSAFHEAMRARYPVKFKGKRRSKDKPKLPIPGLYESLPMLPPGVFSQLLGVWCSCSGK